MSNTFNLSRDANGHGVIKRSNRGSNDYSTLKSDIFGDSSDDDEGEGKNTSSSIHGNDEYYADNHSKILSNKKETLSLKRTYHDIEIKNNSCDNMMDNNINDNKKKNNKSNSDNKRKNLNFSGKQANSSLLSSSSSSSSSTSSSSPKSKKKKYSEAHAGENTIKNGDRNRNRNNKDRSINDTASSSLSVPANANAKPEPTSNNLSASVSATKKIVSSSKAKTKTSSTTVTVTATATAKTNNVKNRKWMPEEDAIIVNEWMQESKPSTSLAFCTAITDRKQLPDRTIRSIQLRWDNVLKKIHVGVNDANVQTWTSEEDQVVIEIYQKNNNISFTDLVFESHKKLPGRNLSAIGERWNLYLKNMKISPLNSIDNKKLSKKWTSDEDAIIVREHERDPSLNVTNLALVVHEYLPERSLSEIASRWNNFLYYDIQNTQNIQANASGVLTSSRVNIKWTPEEDAIILRERNKDINSYTVEAAKHLRNRSVNDVYYRWFKHLSTIHSLENKGKTKQKPKNTKKKNHIVYASAHGVPQAFISVEQISMTEFVQLPRYDKQIIINDIRDNLQINSIKTFPKRLKGKPVNKYFAMKIFRHKDGSYHKVRKSYEKDSEEEVIAFVFDQFMNSPCDNWRRDFVYQFQESHAVPTVATVDHNPVLTSTIGNGISNANTNGSTGTTTSEISNMNCTSIANDDNEEEEAEVEKHKVEFMVLDRSNPDMIKQDIQSNLQINVIKSYLKKLRKQKGFINKYYAIKVNRQGDGSFTKVRKASERNNEEDVVDYVYTQFMEGSADNWRSDWVYKHDVAMSPPPSPKPKPKSKNVKAKKGRVMKVTTITTITSTSSSNASPYTEIPISFEELEEGDIVVVPNTSN